MAVVDRTLWQSIIENVVAHGGHIIRPWFTQLEPISLEHGLLEIQTPGRDEQKYCQDHATRLFTEAAQQATGRLVGVCFLTAAQAESALEDGRYEAEAVPDDDFAPALMPDYRFDSFVQGPCNRMAYAASTAVADAPGRAYNPLYLHGSVGLGKTHLLHAICRKIQAEKPDAKICVLSCETFINHFIAAIGSGQLHEFRYRYRQADLLAVDDIQFLRKHEQTQEEFFHTFNTLHQAQKQIILTSDREPRDLELPERLVSRLGWGMVAFIDKPCYETRVAIVQKKARLRNLHLPEEVICFVATTVESNSRELEGALARIAMLAAVHDRPIDLSLAREALGAKPDRHDRQITIEDILKAVTTRFGIQLRDLQSRKRSRSIVLPRQVCMYLARTLTGHSLEEIGGYFGGRDHTTVLHANKTIDGLYKSDPEFQATLDRLTQEITARA